MYIYVNYPAGSLSDSGMEYRYFLIKNHSLSSVERTQLGAQSDNLEARAYGPIGTRYVSMLSTYSYDATISRISSLYTNPFEASPFARTVIIYALLYECV